MRRRILHDKPGRIFLPGTLAFLVLVLMLANPLVVRAADPAAAEDFDYSSLDLRVAVWLEDRDDGDVLQMGEKFTVGFQANEDAHAVVYHIDVEGRVTILWPRSRYDDGFIFGGHEYILPVTGARRLSAGEEVGEGFVEAIVSAYPFDLRDLELDFHHENTESNFDFQVAGDPFLAMNEVNFVITGLEDSGDYVVTNFVSYYVHQEVDHPRYLCSQCHYEDGADYDPYQDTCTLEIDSNYEWNNNWYDNYGYYPVYSNPVYVYVDPWVYRPWVNFWYTPCYTCAPCWGWGWGYDCWSWCDSPYYGGDCYTYYGNGNTRYRPLDRSHVSDGGRTKTREYDRVTGMVGRGGPDERQRAAMRTRTALADGRMNDDRSAAGRPGIVRGGGTARVPNERPRTSSPARSTGNSGLRIRPDTQARMGGEDGRSPMRHTAGGGSNRSALKPVSRTSSGLDRSRSSVRPDKPAGTRVRPDKPASGRTRVEKPGRSRSQADKPAGSRTIKPVEPRKKGTRIWNSRSGSKKPGRTSAVTPGNRRRPSGVAPGSRSSGGQRRSGKPAAVKPGNTRGKSTSGQGKSRPAPKVKSGGSSKSGSKSGSRSGAGGSRSGGGSRSSGGHGSSRSGSGGRRR